MTLLATPVPTLPATVARPRDRTPSGSARHPRRRCRCGAPAGPCRCGIRADFLVVFLVGLRAHGGCHLVADTDRGIREPVRLSGRRGHELARDFDRPHRDAVRAPAPAGRCQQPAGRPPRPAAPTGFSAETVNSSRIRLRWTDNANNEDGFTIVLYDRAQRIDLAANTTSYLLMNLPPNSRYCYAIAAFNAAGWSGGDPFPDRPEEYVCGQTAAAQIPPARRT